MLPVLVYREAAVGYRDDVQNLCRSCVFLEFFCAIPRLLARVVAFFRLMQSKSLLYNSILAAVDASTSHIIGS